MAKIPIVGDNRIQTQAIQNGQLKIDAPIESFGGGRIAQQVTQTVNNISKEVSDGFDRWNKISVDEEDNAVAKYQQELYLEQSQAKGADAMAKSEEVRKKWKDFTESRKKNLSNSFQIRDFDSKVSARSLRLNTDIEQHVYSETQKHEEEVFKNTLLNAKDEAILKYSDKKRVADSVNTQKIKIAEFAKANGKSEDWVKQMTMANNSEVHEKVIDRFLAESNVEAAKKHYEENKDSILDTDSKLFKLIKDGEELVKVQDAVEDIFSKKLGYSESLAEARKKYSGKQEEDVIKNLKIRLREVDDARTAEAIAAFDEEMDQLETSKGSYVVPPNKWLTLSPQQRNAYDARKDELTGGKYIQTNYAKYHSLVEMALNEDTEREFLKTDLNSLTDINKREINKLSQLKIKLVTTNKQTRIKINNEIKVNDLTKYTLGKYGVDVNKKVGKEAAGRFSVALDKAINDEEVRAGTFLSAEKKQEIAEKLGREYAIDKKFLGIIPYSSTKRGFDIKIPDNDRGAITESYIRKKGKKPTETEILELYLKNKKRREEEKKVIAPSESLLDQYRKGN